MPNVLEKDLVLRRFLLHRYTIILLLALAYIALSVAVRYDLVAQNLGETPYKGWCLNQV